MVRRVGKLPEPETLTRPMKPVTAPDRWTAPPRPSKPAEPDEPNFDLFRARWWPAEKFELPEQ